MQLLKIVHLVAIACTMHVLASPMETRSKAISRDVAQPIIIGTSPTFDGSTFAWTEGTNACDASEVQVGSGNFCGIHFALIGRPGDFVFNGCGGSLWVDRDDYFYANCESYSEGSQCNIVPTYRCA
ncbi:hypothetical protein MVEN_00707600 [Mycena venus]|uniref:Uncharacterized protein n=1 Tax=Mycena venus TaxID=2733690 RepID=A0A8H6YES7_9AGAR|nr:hypothetical protein MVEN_00707600 [Mycena venus]